MMRTTTYVVPSVEAAMLKARTELGEDALLIQTRQGKSGYEVTFALEGSGDPPAAFTPAADFQEISRQLEEIRRTLARTAQTAPAGRSRRIPELSNLQARLIAADVDPVLGKDIIDRVEASLVVEGICQRADLQSKSHASVRMLLNFDFEYIEKLMHAELKRRVRIDANISRKLAVFVGPTGAGKTTSMVKLAMAAGGCVRLMSLDTTPGAREEMKLYANLSGLDFVPLLSPAKLPRMLQGLKDADLILVDGDPLANMRDVRNVVTVVKSGIIVDAVAAQAALSIAPR